MRSKTPYFVGTWTLLAWPAIAQAETVAYVRASSQLDRETAPERYHPLNLLDDDPNTMWCEASPGLGEGEEVRFFFKRPQPIDRIVIGPAKDTGRLVTSVKVSDGTNTIRIGLGDAFAERILKQPLSGTIYTVTIDQVGGPNDGAKLPPNVACLAEVLLYSKGKLFGGKTPNSAFRYEKWRDRVLGRWSGAPLGAPESFMIFAIDGSWEWTYVPILGGKTERISGEYRFRGNRMLMRRGETGRWNDVGFSYERVKVNPDDIGAPLKDYDLIRINKSLGDKIGGDYNNAEF